MIPAYLRWYWDCQKVTFSVLTQRQKWYMKKQAKRSSITCWWRFWVWHYRSPTVIRNCLRWTLPIGSFAYMSFKWATLVLLHSYYRLHKQNGNSSWNVFPAIFQALPCLLITFIFSCMDASHYYRPRNLYSYRNWDWTMLENETFWLDFQTLWIILRDAPEVFSWFNIKGWRLDYWKEGQF